MFRVFPYISLVLSIWILVGAVVVTVVGALSGLILIPIFSIVLVVNFAAGVFFFVLALYLMSHK